MEKLLEVKDLKVDFHLENQVIQAVRGVSFEIKPNEVVVLAGESGSGKSVTALSLTRILPVNAKIVSGKVIFHKQDLMELEEPELIRIRGREISYIFQEPASFLNPVYTIGNQICEVIMLHQHKSKIEAGRISRELLTQVKIKEPQRVFSSYPHQLSGGMNQRAFLAMSLAANPRLLIADEPTTSLDVTIEAEILKLFLELKEKFQFSLLFITHNLSIARKIADRVLVMYQGKIVESKNKEDIFKDPEHSHTKELIAAYEKIGRITS